MIFRRKDDDAPASDLKIVVGLGNIGKQYEGTRHNIGFEVVDEVARLHGGHFRVGKFKGEEATVNIAGQKVLLLKPHTLMNLSGEAVAAAARFYRIPPQRILIVCDDVNLPVGKLRIRAKGSDGGHNGLWSIGNRLRSQEFPRLRIGVGCPPPEWDMADYVLSRYPSRERQEMNDARERAARAVEYWLSEPFENAQNSIHALNPRPPKPRADEESANP